MISKTTAPMQDQRARWLRIATSIFFWLLAAVWLFCMLWTPQRLARSGPIGAVLVSYPQSAQYYPEFLGSVAVSFLPRQSEPVHGDRLLRAGELDLRGVGPVMFFVRVWQARIAFEERFETPLTFTHNGVEAHTTAVFGRNRMVLWFTVISLIEGLLALAVRLRADGAAARAFTVATMLHATAMSGGFVAESWFGAHLINFGFLLVVTVLPPSGLRCVLLVPEETAPRRRWPYWATLLAIGPSVPHWLFLLGLTRFERISTEQAWSLAMLANAGLGVLGFGLLLYHYRQAAPLGRRQLRWALFGLAISVPAVVAAFVIWAVAPQLVALTVPLFLATLVVPFSIAAAILWFDLFDIDRVINVASAYALTMFVCVAAGVAIVPSLSSAFAGVLGLTPAVIQTGLAIMLAAAMFPIHRSLRPLIDRVFFKERLAFQQGFGELLQRLSTCDSLPSLGMTCGTALVRLINPQSCSVYCLAAEQYIAVYEHRRAGSSGHAAAIERSSALVAALASQPGPLALPQKTERGVHSLDPFAALALTTLGATVALPVRRGRDLVAFICLGAKRSGDVYTATDLALLTGVADKLGSESRRFEPIARHVQPFMDGVDSRVSPLPIDAANLMSTAGGDMNVEQGAAPVDQHGVGSRTPNCFQREGEFWTIRFAGTVVRLKDSKGLQYLGRLLAMPDQEIFVLDMVGAHGSLAAALHVSALPGPDSKARSAYRQRLHDLRDELAQAEAHNDPSRRSQIEAEIESLTREIAAAFGVAGRSRKSSPHIERARSAVTKRVRDALQKISEAHPALGDYLYSTITTGYYCTYKPQRSVDWQIET